MEPHAKPTLMQILKGVFLTRRALLIWGPGLLVLIGGLFILSTGDAFKYAVYTWLFMLGWTAVAVVAELAIEGIKSGEQGALYRLFTAIPGTAFILFAIVLITFRDPYGYVFAGVLLMFGVPLLLFSMGRSEYLLALMERIQEERAQRKQHR